MRHDQARHVQRAFKLQA